MPRKIVSVSIDEKSNLHADFSGYPGRTCEAEEEKLRKIMEELGLEVNIIKALPKKEGPAQFVRITSGKKISA